MQTDAKLPSLLAVVKRSKSPMQTDATFLGPFAHPVARVVRSCCAKFETGQTFSYAQTDATTPNIVGPTMLGVVASVCR